MSASRILRAHLSEWLDHARQGDAIIVTDRGTRVSCARRIGLRGADGVHLACARAFTAERVDLVMAVWDVRLAAGAKAAGIRVAPA